MLSQTGPRRVNTGEFEVVPDRTGTASVKWDRYGGRDILPLWVADMDFAAPPPVIAALEQRVRHGIFGYTHASESLVTAFRACTLERFGWAVEPEWLVWLAGAVPALHTACELIGADRRVVTALPIYPPFLQAPPRMQREHLAVPLVHEPDGRPVRDVEAIARALAGGGNLLLLCNPHNPSGQVAGRAELEALAAAVVEQDALVVSDELHADLVLDPQRRHLPLASLGPEIAARSITLLAPSKTFNLAGLGLTCAVIPDPGLRRRFQAAIEGRQPFVTTLAWTAAEAAWRDGWAWHAGLLARLRANRDRVTAVLAELPGVAARPPEGTYLYWLDLRACGLADPLRHLEAHGLGLSDGADFGAPGFARLNFACPPATLETALARLRDALGG